MATEIILRVNGREFGGWKSARVTRSIESIAGGFELTVSDRWADQEEAWQIFEEDECIVLVDGNTLITGYVDRRRMSYGPTEHSLEVSGRDKTGALVDCSAVLKSWEFKSIPLATLAKRLCDPFGIPVALDASVGGTVTLQTGKSGGTISSAGKSGKRGGLGIPNPPKKFSVDPGESAFEVLDRACRLAGVLPISDGAGGLLLTRAGSDRTATALVEGENILAASAEYDASARYRRYVVAAQHPATDDWFGNKAAAVHAEAADLGVRRTERILMIRPEASATSEMAKLRAAWEAKIRAARGDAFTVTVQGWTQASGELWPVNALVHLRSPTAGVDGDLLITQTVFSVDSFGGTTTQITLKRPDAFLPESSVSKVKRSGSGLWKEIAKGV